MGLLEPALSAEAGTGQAADGGSEGHCCVHRMLLPSEVQLLGPPMRGPPVSMGHGTRDQRAATDRSGASTAT